MRAKRRTIIVAIILAVLAAHSLGALGAPAAQSAVQKPSPLDFAKALTSVGELADQSVYVVGRASMEATKGATRLCISASKGDYTMPVEAAFSRPLTGDIGNMDTVLITGRVSKESTSKRLILAGGACERVCRLRGRMGDGDVAYDKAVLFALPYGSVERAIASGKEGLAELVTRGRIAGVASSTGEYDVMVALGKSDIMAIYRDPKGKIRSMLWMISMDFGADTLRIDLGPKTALML